MASAPDNSSLSSDQDINQFFMQVRIEPLLLFLKQMQRLNRHTTYEIKGWDYYNYLLFLVTKEKKNGILKNYIGPCLQIFKTDPKLSPFKKAHKTQAFRIEFRVQNQQFTPSPELRPRTRALEFSLHTSLSLSLKDVGQRRRRASGGDTGNLHGFFHR